MEKYAVVIDDEKTKTASTDNTCPKCGTRVGVQTLKQTFTRTGPFIPHCPNCGTEPFEKRPDSK